MSTARVSVLAGDGIGPEVTTQALKVLHTAADIFGFAIEFDHVDLGAEQFLRSGQALNEPAVEQLRASDAILLGAMGDPRVPPGILERGVIVALRSRFRQSVNVRPAKLLPGVQSRLRDVTDDQCDLVIVRENTEGPYAGGGSIAQAGTEHAVAVQTSITTAAATEAAVRFAFTLALRRRHRLALCHKTNILIESGQLWSDTMAQVGVEFPDVSVDYVHADAMCLHLVNDPHRFDVIVTDNLFGDILSDLGAAISGGLGYAASANLNLDGTAPSMFEPVHGSAPDIAGRSLANPSAAVLSAAMLLDQLGFTDAGQACRVAVGCAVLAQSESDSPLHTERFGDLIVDSLARATSA